MTGSDKPHLLVAEDDPAILSGLIDLFEDEGYRVTPAKDGEAAQALFDGGTFDLIILDVMMPGKNGYDVCRHIRARNRQVPVIMLTAKGEEIDKVVGLRLGADDYVTKPFGVHELLARTEAALRRAAVVAAPGEAHKDRLPFRFGAARIEPAQYRAVLGRTAAPLSDKELRLILHFFDSPRRVLHRDDLLNAVWGINYFGTTRTLDQHVANIRKKIEPVPRRPVFLVTVHGVGYRYDPPDADEQ